MSPITIVGFRRVDAAADTAPLPPPPPPPSKLEPEPEHEGTKPEDVAYAIALIAIIATGQWWALPILLVARVLKLC